MGTLCWTAWHIPTCQDTRGSINNPLTELLITLTTLSLRRQNVQLCNGDVSGPDPDASIDSQYHGWGPSCASTALQFVKSRRLAGIE